MASTYHAFGDNGPEKDPYRRQSGADAERSYPAVWFAQFRTLLIKNFVVLRHRWPTVLLILIIPAVFVLLLSWLSSVVGGAPGTDTPLQLPHCKTFNVYGQEVDSPPEPCITVLFGPHTPMTESVMTYLAQQNGLTYGKDVVPQETEADVAGYIFDKLGKQSVYSAVVFNSTVNRFNNVQYQLWVNTSSLSDYSDNLFQTSGYSANFLALQRAVDQGIISHEKGSAATLDVTVGTMDDFGSDPLSSGSNMFLLFASGTFIASAVAVVCLLVLNVIVAEKQKALLGLLRNIGLFESTHWLSWFAAFLPIMFASAIVTAAVGNATGLSLFTKCNYGVHLVSLFMFLASMVALAMCIGSFVRQTKWVNLSAFLVFALSVIIASVFVAAGLFDEVYSPSFPFIVAVLMWPMPWFHYCRILYDVLVSINGDGNDSGSNSNGASNKGVLHHFSFGDLSKPLAAEIAKVGGHTVRWSPPAPAWNLWMMFLLCITFSCLSWYFGQVASGDLGASQPFYFIFSPRYWGFGTKKRTIVEGDTLAKEQLKSAQEGSIRVHKLSKSYDKTTALKEVTLRMQPGRLFCLLGQNGAGKTTLINCLSGLLEPTHGEAFLFGSSVRADVATLRARMGTCPQHDLLWEELSAYQHFKLFARFKGVSEADLSEHIRHRLIGVNLEDVAGSPVTSFSGGMKRRLSVGLASVGDPDLIFLDEPSTGMDPVNRRSVWETIQKLKKDRIVVLTTHSMEEADALGDDVAILAGGKLRAVGSPLFLKNRFGAGYSLNLLTTPERVDELKAFVTQNLPGAEIVAGDAASKKDVMDDEDSDPDAGNPKQAEDSTPDSASADGDNDAGEALQRRNGALTVALPREYSAHIPTFLRLLSSNSDTSESADGSKLISNWSIQGSTLEEVFLRLAAQNRGVNYTEFDFSGDAAPKVCVLCEDCPPEMVTLYTSQQVAVETADLICAECAQRTPADFEALHRRLEARRTGAHEEFKAPPAAVAPAVGAGGYPAANGAANGKAAAHAMGASETRGAGHAREPPAGSLNAAPRNEFEDRKAIPLSKQTLAVLMLRLQLQHKQRKTNICYVVFLIFAVFLIWVSTPKAKGLGGDRCTAGSFVDQGYCHKSNWTDYLTYAVETAQSSHNTGPFCNYNNPVNSPYISPAIVNNLFSTICASAHVYPGSTYPSCPYDGCSQQYYPNTFQARVMRNWQGQYPPSTATTRPSTMAWYSAPDSGDDLSEYNFLGLGAGKSDLNWTATYLQKPRRINSLVYQSQQTVQSRATALDSTCDGSGMTWTDVGYQVDTMEEAFQFSREHFPDFGLDFFEASTADAAWEYTLRLYNRNNVNGEAYKWTEVFNAAKQGYCNVFEAEVYDETNAYDNMNNAPLMGAAALSAVHSILYRQVTGTNGSILTSYVQMPRAEWQAAVPSSAVGFQTFLVPLFVWIQFPSFVSTIAGEKQALLFQQMRISGLRDVAYWTACAVSFFMTSWIMTLLLFAFAFLFSVSTFSNCGFGILLALSLLWSYSAIGYAFLLGSAFRHSRPATILSYLIVVAVSIASSLMDQFLSSWSRGLAWVPFLSFARAIGLALKYGGTSIESGSELQIMMIGTACTGTIALFLGPYLHAVLPGVSENAGVPKHPLFIFDSCRRRSRDSSTQSSDPGAPLLGANSSGGKYASDPSAMDADVAAERARVMNRTGGPAPTVELRSLFKDFPAKITKTQADNSGCLPDMCKDAGIYRAVDDMCLAVGRGETLGLLGPNGAGKSTTLNILAGNVTPSSGSCTVGGFDVATQMDRVHRVLGICPQFDTVFPDLTVREHLVFYSRLKGIRGDLITAVVQQTAEKVQLDGDSFNARSQDLSGGMRRRLSIAIALIGAPDCVLMDEPTTGLDPETRRQIWDIVTSEAHSGRCIIVTTHSMEEADALCTRIAIMCNGRMRCVGTQLHLKKRFGDGYKLMMSLASDSDDQFRSVSEFVDTHVAPGAKLVHRVGATVAFMLPREGVEVADVFATMEAEKQRVGVKDWGVSLTSLEEVFVKVVEAAEQEAAAASNSGPQVLVKA